MAFDKAWARRVQQGAIRLARCIRYEALDVRKAHLKIRMHKIRHQETCPEIAGLCVGDDERVVGIDAEVPPRLVRAENVFANRLRAVDHLPTSADIVVATPAGAAKAQDHPNGLTPQSRERTVLGST